MNRCVITGADGLIGSEVIAQLLARGGEVHAISRRSEDRVVRAGLTWHNFDLAREWSDDELPAHVDSVIYLAQSEHFREFPEHALDVLNVNTLAALRFADYARRAGAQRFVFGSSGGVYGSGTVNFSEDVVVPAASDLGFYLGTKLCSEILLGAYAGLFDVTILRFFFVYGAAQRRTMLIPRLVDSIIAGNAIALQGPDGLRLNPTHVSDAARAVVRALDLRGNHKINVGGPEALSLREICEHIGRLVGVSPVFDVDEKAASVQLVGDVEKMSRLVGPPTVHFAEGVTEMVRGSGVRSPQLSL